MATLVLSKDLRLRYFTPQAANLFDFAPANVGSPVSDHITKLRYNTLVEDIQQVLATQVPQERKINYRPNQWLLARILPHRAADDEIIGVVITFWGIRSTGVNDLL